MNSELTLLQRRFERERKARKEAEAILEAKSLALFQANQTLQELTTTLERRVEERTAALQTANVALLNEIRQRESAEINLKNLNARLSTLLHNMQEAILVEDEHRRIQLVNEPFCKLFHIPVSPEALIGQDCSGAAEQSKHFFKDPAPDVFVADIEQLLFRKRTVIADVLTMVTGKVLERDYLPIWLDNEYRGHLWLYRDVTERRRFMDQLSLLSLVADKTENAVVITDPNAHIQWVNRGFEQLTGFTLEESLGKKPGQFLQGPETSAETIAEIKDKLREKVSFTVELLNYTKDKKTYWIRLDVTPIFNEVGEVQRYIAIETDVSYHKEAEQKQEALLNSLQMANQDLKEFAYVVSHDLKAPLRGIGSLAGWLKQDYAHLLDPEGQELIDLMIQRSQRMHNLIEGVLEYSRVGRMQDKVELIETQAVAEAIIRAFDLPPHIQVLLQTDLPEVYYERIKFEQVLQNLMSNAIKFLDKPKGVVEIGCQDLGAFWQFYVKDNGPGIAEVHYTKIFQIFQTLQPRDTFESTGVGLSIVKKIVETHGGRIHLTSTVGEGTTFFFTVPKTRANHATR